MQEPQAQKISPLYFLIARHLNFFQRDCSLADIKNAAEAIVDDNTSTQQQAKPKGHTLSHSD